MNGMEILPWPMRALRLCVSRRFSYGVSAGGKAKPQRRVGPAGARMIESAGLFAAAFLSATLLPGSSEAAFLAVLAHGGAPRAGARGRHRWAIRWAPAPTGRSADGPRITATTRAFR